MKTTYKVIAEDGWAGYQAGDEFEADLGRNAERWAIEQGLLEPVKKAKTTRKNEAEEADDA